MKVRRPNLEALYKEVDNYIPAKESLQPPRIGISANRRDGLSCIAETCVPSGRIHNTGILGEIVPVVADKLPSGLHLTAAGKIIVISIKQKPACCHNAVRAEVIRFVVEGEPAGIRCFIIVVVIPFSIPFYPADDVAFVCDHAVFIGGIFDARFCVAPGSGAYEKMAAVCIIFIL